MRLAQPTSTVPILHKYACTVCARRKVRCDRTKPCSNCSRSKVQCLYQAPVPPRPRKCPISDHVQNFNVPYKQSDDIGNVWMTSGSETGVVDGEVTSSRARNTVNESLERCRWSSLDAELRNPPMQSFPLRENLENFESCWMTSFQALWPATSLVELHPEPIYIFRLWQIFVEKVDPVTKIVHVPSLQQRIMEASWNLENVTKSTEAIMFAIYTLAITSLGALECQSLFSEDKQTMLKRYKAATIQTLMAAGLLTTRDLDVLQAFVLFLLADPHSDFTSTLTAVAIRIGHKMGLHEAHDPNTSGLPFFEEEMRIRTWWQLRAYDAHTSKTSNTGSFLKEPGSPRLPLNINDADLHPSMAGPPIEHTGPTEMLYVLMKYEGGSWVRTSPTAAKVFSNPRELLHGPQARSVKDAAIDELEALYETKYLSKCDPRIPLHALAIAMTRLAIARMRFKVHHPRLGNEIDRGVSDMLFQNGVLVLRLGEETRKSKYAVHLLSHMTERSQMDALVYVVSELRRRWAGDLVDMAWRVVEDLYKEHPELIEEETNTFYVALGDLTLEAWEARQIDLIRSHGAWESNTVPQFIQSLRNKRDKGSTEAGHATMEEPLTISPMLGVDATLDWDYWNELMRF